MTRLFTAIWRLMAVSAASRLSFWAVLVIPSLFAMLHFRDDAPAAAASWLAFAFPAALCSGWSGGETRRALISSLALTRAGAGPLLGAELTLSVLGGGLLSLVPLSMLPGTLPWQTWFVAPLSSLFVAAVALWLEPRSRALSGLVLGLLAALAYAPSGRGLPALLAVPGYTFRAFEGPAAGRIHPDAYFAMSVVLAACAVFLSATRTRALGGLCLRRGA